MGASGIKKWRATGRCGVRGSARWAARGFAQRTVWVPSPNGPNGPQSAVPFLHAERIGTPWGPLSEQGFNMRCFNMLQHASTQFVGTRGLFEMTRNDRKWPKMDGIVGFKSYSSWFPNPTGAVTCWRRNLRGRINEVLRLVDAGEVWQLVTTCHTTP